MPAICTGAGPTTFSAFLSPRNPVNGWLWGIGPVVQIPTASSSTLGSNVWDGGITGVLVYMKGPWVIGALANNVWSAGGTSGNGGTRCNAFLAQPFVNYNFGEGWYVTTAPVITANWRTAGDKAWTLHVGGGAGHQARREAANQPGGLRLLQRPAAGIRTPVATPYAGDAHLLTALSGKGVKMSQIVHFIQVHLLSLSALAKFAIGMVILVAIPRLCRRLHVPTAVGLLLGGVLIGPYVLGFFGTDRPVADFMAELGKLLLMFFAGLEIDLALFRRARNRAISFGIATTALALVLGTVAGLAFGYGVIPAVVIGSLLASHTLLGLGALDKLGLKGLEPVTVTVGATVMSDTLSLVVFAVCLSIYTIGFSASSLVLLLLEIAGYILFVLFGLSRVASFVLKRVEDEEDAYFVLMLGIMAIAGVLADAIQLPGIVGAFLAGLAVNASARDKPASAKLEFLAKSLFIPIFFIVTGFLIDPVQFVRGILDNSLLVAGVIAAPLVGKWIAAWLAGRSFGDTRDEQLTVWSLTLPQVAATLAATLVAHATVGPSGQRLLDDRMLNVVLVMVLVTAIMGPVLTELFGSRLAGPRNGSSASLEAPDLVAPPVIGGARDPA